MLKKSSSDILWEAGSDESNFRVNICAKVDPNKNFSALCLPLIDNPRAPSYNNKKTKKKGGFHKNVIKVLIEFRKAAENAGHPNVPSLVSLRHRLSAALVTGNYQIVQSGLDKMARVV